MSESVLQAGRRVQPTFS